MGVALDKFFIGASGDLMLMFIPNRFGLTFGLGLSGKYNTANYYKSDIGLKVEFGLKF